MNLCGIEHKYEQYFDEKIAANRITQNLKFVTENTTEYWACSDNMHNKNEGVMNLAGLFHSIVLDGESIIRSIKTGNPKDIYGNLIDKQIVKRESYILSNCLKEIHQIGKERSPGLPPEYIDEKFEIEPNVEISLGKMMALVSDLSKEFLLESLADDLPANLLLSSKFDRESSFNILPLELHKTIALKYLQVKIGEI